MSQRPNDDLFAGTTMTFGEHLEELRFCLFRALIGLVIGAGVGMLVADKVVEWIKTPLTSAIERYFVSLSIDQLKAEYKESLPPEFVQFINEHRVTFEEVYFERSELKRILEEADKPAIAKPPKITPLTEQSAEETQRAAKVLDDVAKSKLGIPSPDIVHTRFWKPMRIQPTSLNAQEVFMIWMKASLVTGTVLASPWIFYQIWIFVAAGLYPHEKNYVYIYLPLSVTLFIGGAALAFFFVFEPVLDFLFSFNKAMNINPEPRISEWLGFVLLMPIGFGVSFQLPLVMLFIHRIGVVSLEMYTTKWRIAILAIFVISAVLTPADPVSLLFMAGPLTVLYFLGIGLCKWMPRSRNPYAGVAVE